MQFTTWLTMKRPVGQHSWQAYRLIVYARWEDFETGVEGGDFSFANIITGKTCAVSALYRADTGLTGASLAVKSRDAQFRK